MAERSGGGSTGRTGLIVGGTTGGELSAALEASTDRMERSCAGVEFATGRRRTHFSDDAAVKAAAHTEGERSAMALTRVFTHIS